MDLAHLSTNGEYDLLPIKVHYRKAVEALYITNTRCPDIATVMSILCRRVDKPRQRDWNMVKQVIQYFKQTVGFK